MSDIKNATLVDDILAFVKEVKNQLKINSASIFQECIEQAFFYEDISEVSAEVRHASKKAKANLERVRSACARDIRTNPGNYGAVKITDSAVLELIPLQAVYKEAEDLYLTSLYLVDLLQGLMESAGQRKSMLRDIVTLYTYNYQSQTPISTNIAREAAADERERQIAALRMKEQQEDRNQDLKDERQLEVESERAGKSTENN